MRVCCARCPSEFDARLRAPEAEVRTYLEKLDQTLSNVLQLSPQRGLLANDFDAELDRLFHDYVARPPSARSRNRRKHARVDSQPAERRLPAAPDSGQTRTQRPRRGVHAAGRPAASRLRVSLQRNARLHPDRRAGPRSLASQGAGLHGRMHPRARGEFRISRPSPKSSRRARIRAINSLRGCWRSSTSPWCRSTVSRNSPRSCGRAFNNSSPLPEISRTGWTREPNCVTMSSRIRRKSP